MGSHLGSGWLEQMVRIGFEWDKWPGREAAGEKQEIAGLASRFMVSCQETLREAWQDTQGGWQDFPVTESPLVMMCCGVGGLLWARRLGLGS